MSRPALDLPRVCKAAVLVEHGQPLELREVPLPPRLEPGALLVRNRAATLCGTDVHMWRGTALRDRPRPTILGHEMVGEIVGFGDGEHTDSIGRPLQIGDRITWTHGECGHCYYCVIEGEPTLCENWRLYMVGDYREFPHLIGGLAEYTYVFPTSGRLLVPEDLTDEVVSASSCAMRTVVAAMERLGPLRPTDTVVVQGAGPVGLFAAAAAITGGADQVIVVGGPESRLEIARAWGAVVLPYDGPESDEAVLRGVLDATNGRGADVVIEASGAPRAFLQGVDMSRRGARYLIVGQVHEQEVPFNPSVLVMKQLNLIGSKSATVRHYYRALEFLRRTSDRFDWNRLFDAPYRLDEVMAAFDAMAEWRELKPVIRFDDGQA